MSVTEKEGKKKTKFIKISNLDRNTSSSVDQECFLTQQAHKSKVNHNKYEIIALSETRARFFLLKDLMELSWQSEGKKSQDLIIHKC